MYSWITFLPLILAVLMFGLFAKLAARLRRAKLAWRHALVFAALTFTLGAAGALINRSVSTFLPMPLAVLTALLMQLVLGGWYFGPRATTRAGEPLMLRGGAMLALIAYLLALGFAVVAAVGLSYFGTVTSGAPATVSPIPRPTTAADCAAHKGLWTTGPGPIRQDVPEYCTLPAGDAGKQCKSSSECSSRLCASDDSRMSPGAKASGICAAFNMGGCMVTVEDGVVKPEICVE